MNIVLHFIITALTFCVMTVSLNLTVGTGGLFNLGHVAFAGIGAYSSVLLIMKLKLPWLLAFPAAGLLAAVFGAVIGLISLKLKGDYFAIATMGFGLVVQSVLNNWQGLTRGPMGIPGIPAPSLLGLRLTARPMQAAYMALVLLLVLWAVRRLTRSPWGRALKAVRDDEFAALAFGKPVLRLKVQAVAISAFFAGLAGAMQAHYIRFISPVQWGLADTVYYLLAVILGGLGNHWGAVLGGVLFVALRQALPYLGLPTGAAGPAEQLLFSLVLILLMLFRPKGLLPEGRFKTAAGGAPADE